MRSILALPLAINFLAGCSDPCADPYDAALDPTCPQEDSYQPPHTTPVVNNFAPQLRVFNLETGDHRQTSTDFGDSYSDTNLLALPSWNCQTVEVGYELFDRDGNEIRPLAYVDGNEHEWHREPFELETDSSELVEPNFATTSDKRFLEQISARHFSGDESGTFSFELQSPNNRSDWWIDVLFAAYDGEHISGSELTVQFQVNCE